MNKTITTFNGWLLAKILKYLTKECKFTVETSNYTANGIQAIIQDATGTRYQIKLHQLSPNNDSSYLTTGGLNVEKPNILAFVENSKTFIN